MLKDRMNTQTQEKVVECQTWDDLFNLTIDISKRETHCATLAYFKEVVVPYNANKGYGIATFYPIPMTTDQETYELQAYFFDPYNQPNITDMGKLPDIGVDKQKYYDHKKFEADFSKIYCIIFTDYNFKNALETKMQISTTDKDIHSLSYGVVVNLK